MKPGDKFWWFRIGFYRSGSTWKSQRPIQLIVTSMEPRDRGCWVDGAWTTMPESYYKLEDRRGIVRLEGWKEEFDKYSFYRLYPTKEEAIEAWNREVQDELDLALSDYEERVRRIKKKLI